MTQILEFIEKYQNYIARFVIGALAAVLFIIIVDLPVWISGGIIALIASPATDFAMPYFEKYLENFKAAQKEKSQNIAHDE